MFIERKRKLNKTIAIAGIIGAFVVGVLTANPVVEAAGGWKAAIEDLQNQIDDIELLEGPQGEQGEQGEQGSAGPLEVYEVSGVSVISADSIFGTLVELRCLDGDVYLDPSPSVTLRPQPPPSDEIPSIISADITAVHESDATKIFFSRIIGSDVTAINQGILQPFPITVTVVGLCVSPSP